MLFNTSWKDAVHSTANLMVGHVMIDERVALDDDRQQTSLIKRTCANTILESFTSVAKDYLTKV
jgi:hypothetical protein